MNYIYIAGCLVAGFVSAAMSDYRFSSQLESNTVEGYHCQPVTKHTGIESAKAQVAKYQAMVRG